MWPAAMGSSKMNENTLILTVEDRFHIPQRGVVIIPGLQHPDGKWVSFTASILVRPPNGSSFSAVASFNTEHFLYAGGHGEYKVVISVKELAKENIQKGSQIFVDQETKSRIGMTA